MSDFSVNQNERQIPWTLIDLITIFVVAILFATLVGQLGFGIFYTIDWRYHGALEVLVAFLATLVQNLVLFGLSFFVVKNKYAYSLWNNLFKFPKENTLPIMINGIIGGLGILFGVMIINLILGLFLIYYFDYKPAEQIVIQYLLKTPDIWLFIGYTILIVLIAPIAEETFFRGLVYPYLRNKFGVKIAYFLSALFFGIMHQNAWALLGIFIAGFGLAYLFEKSGSLFTCILAHMVWNGVTILLIYATGQIAFN